MQAGIVLDTVQYVTADGYTHFAQVCLHLKTHLQILSAEHAL